MYEQNETMASSPEVVEEIVPTEAVFAEAIAAAITESESRNECDDGSGDCNGDGASESGDMDTDPAAPPQPVDPPAQALDADPKADSELELLRRELTQLRAKVDGQARAMQRIGFEYEEFCDLYPEKSPDELPDEVWDLVQRGIPLSAAYALTERKRLRKEEKARAINEENRRRSSGALESGTPGYFSPDEVRAMSQAEVRANYQNILLSMQKWR